jgi:hypothetical protein
MKKIMGHKPVEIVLQQNADCSGKCVGPATYSALKAEKSEKVHGGKFLTADRF